MYRKRTLENFNFVAWESYFEKEVFVEAEAFRLL
jgi:hypothetical protein